MLTTSVEAICFNYRPKKDNTYPIMLRLTKSGKRKYVSLGMSVKEEHWDFRKNMPRKNCPNREAILKLISNKVSAYNNQIMDFKAQQREYTLNTLVQSLEMQRTLRTVGDVYDQIIEDLHKSDKLGNEAVYRYSKRSLLKFNHTLDIPFCDIDRKWLERYEIWIKGNWVTWTFGVIKFSKKVPCGHFG